MARRLAQGTALVFACALLSVPGVAFAQQYDKTFTLPAAGQSGCMVCHSDPNTGRLEGDRWVSYFVNSSGLESGPHANIMCNGCHSDFAYKAPHDAVDEWVATARSACRNCHAEQFKAYVNSAHAPGGGTGEAGAEEVAGALCGDCHGPAHDIVWLKDDPAGQAQLHARGFDVCGRCHQDYWDSYADYYHGAAYKQGAKDAPSCWDCHGSHNILASSNRQSRVSAENLQGVCSECHSEVTQEFAESYQPLVHRRSEAFEANPLYVFVQNAQDTIQDLWTRVRSWFS